MEKRKTKKALARWVGIGGAACLALAISACTYDSDPYYNDGYNRGHVDYDSRNDRADVYFYYDSGRSSYYHYYYRDDYCLNYRSRHPRAAATSHYCWRGTWSPRRDYRWRTRSDSWDDHRRRHRDRDDRWDGRHHWDRGYDERSGGYRDRDRDGRADRYEDDRGRRSDRY